MKANKTPEKIYLSAVDLEEIGYLLEESNDSKDVEYVRTDAFVEAVADWMYDNLQTVVDVNYPSAHHVESIAVLGIITQTEFVEKFKKEIMFLID